MPTTQEKQKAREWALREVVALLGIPQRGGVITYGHGANSYASEKEKELVDREIDRIRWGLMKRHDKARRALGI